MLHVLLNCCDLALHMIGGALLLTLVSITELPVSSSEGRVTVSVKFETDQTFRSLGPSFRGFNQFGLNMHISDKTILSISVQNATNFKITEELLRIFI